MTKYIPRLPKYNLENDYPSYYTVYDESRTTYSRLLPRQPDYTRGLPDLDATVDCFCRTKFIPETNRNLSLLVGHYAQWFAHQLFNTKTTDALKTRQPLGLNLSQLYGSTESRMKSLRSGQIGLLNASHIGNEEFPPIIDIPQDLRHLLPGEKMFDIPIELANTVPGFAAIHVLFFRRHQYVCREINKWATERGIIMDDEELFQKAMVIVMINCVRITMHDYVGRGLQTSYVKIKFDQAVKQSKMWKFLGPDPYPPCNAIQTEFNFLHRWHQFYPDEVKIIKELPLGYEEKMNELAPDVNIYETDSLTFPEDEDSWLDENWNSVKWIADKDGGLERILFSASSQRAGKLTLLNTNKWFLKKILRPGMRKTREYQLGSYNDYREHFGFGRLKRFEEITSNEKILTKLKEVYGEVDQIEYYPGIFAEDKDFDGVHGPFLGTISVGMMLSGICASRLFEPEIFNEDTLTPRGWQLANEINNLSDLTRMHTKLGDARIRFTVPPSNSL
ncbi:prostaglandin G/H synthase [Gracilaria domingensis]|nr:prostaglandin G/H synthase [Gracilaria domingensis]